MANNQPALRRRRAQYASRRCDAAAVIVLLCGALPLSAAAAAATPSSPPLPPQALPPLPPPVLPPSLLRVPPPLQPLLLPPPLPANASSPWTLVRRVAPAVGLTSSWHPAGDALGGTATYGAPDAPTGASTFSVPFAALWGADGPPTVPPAAGAPPPVIGVGGNASYFLFSTGDAALWLIAPFSSINAGDVPYDDTAAPRAVSCSSASLTAYTAQWVNRGPPSAAPATCAAGTACEPECDPWVSVLSYGASDGEPSLMLYAEDGCAVGADNVAQHNGANVWVASLPVGVDPCAAPLPWPQAYVPPQYAAAPPGCAQAVLGDVGVAGGVLSADTCALCAALQFCPIGFDEFSGLITGWPTPALLTCSSNYTGASLNRSDAQGRPVLFCAEPMHFTSSWFALILTGPLLFVVGLAAAALAALGSCTRGATSGAKARVSSIARGLSVAPSHHEKVQLGCFDHDLADEMPRTGTLPSYDIDSLTAEQQAHYIHELADGFVVFSRPELRLAAPTGAWWYPALCEKKLPLGLPPLGAALWLLRLVPRLLKAMWVAWGCVKVEWTFGQYLVAIWFWPLPHMWRYYQAIRRVVTDPELVAKFDPATVSFVSDLRFFFQNQHTLWALLGGAHPLCPSFMQRRVRALQLVSELCFNFFLSYVLTLWIMLMQCGQCYWNCAAPPHDPACKWECKQCDRGLLMARLSFGHPVGGVVGWVAFLVSLLGNAFTLPFHWAEVGCMQCPCLHCHDRSRFKKTARGVGFWTWIVAVLPVTVTLFIFAVLGSSGAPVATAFSTLYSMLLQYFGFQNVQLFLSFCLQYREQVEEEAKKAAEAAAEEEGHAGKHEPRRHKRRPHHPHHGPGDAAPGQVPPMRRVSHAPVAEGEAPAAAAAAAALPAGEGEARVDSREEAAPAAAAPPAVKKVKKKKAARATTAGVELPAGQTTAAAASAPQALRRELTAPAAAPALERRQSAVSAAPSDPPAAAAAPALERRRSAVSAAPSYPDPPADANRARRSSTPALPAGDGIRMAAFTGRTRLHRELSESYASLLARPSALAPAPAPAPAAARRGRQKMQTPMPSGEWLERF